MPLRTIDIIVSVYLLLVPAIGFAGRYPVRNIRIYTGVNLLLAGLVLLLGRYRDKNRLIYFVSCFYPLLLYTYMYESIQPFVLSWRAAYIDRPVYEFELALFGLHPTQFLDHFIRPAVTEFMKLTYHSYYYLVSIPPLILYFGKRMREYFFFITAVSIAFYISYIGFIVFPVEGPRYTLERLHVNLLPFKGYIFTALQDFIMAKGSLRGGCMPSSHVACALVSVWLSGKFISRKWYPLLFADFIFLSISTVYCRYHYLSDVAAGLAVGLLALRATAFLEKRNLLRY